MVCRKSIQQTLISPSPRISEASIKLVQCLYPQRSAIVIEYVNTCDSFALIEIFYIFYFHMICYCVVYPLDRED